MFWQIISAPSHFTSVSASEVSLQIGFHTHDKDNAFATTDDYTTFCKNKNAIPIATEIMEYVYWLTYQPWRYNQTEWLPYSN